MRPLTIILGFAVIVMAAVRYGPILFASSHPLPPMWKVTDFTLTQRTGQPFASSELHGKVWVADLFYTTCPGPCPMLTSRLSEVARQLANDDDVRLVSISSDPEKDTPAVLQQYAAKFGAGPRWLFLTGPKPAIYRLANEGLKLGLAEVPDAKEPITHSTKLILVDKHGTVRGLYDGVGPDQTGQLLADIRRLKSEP